MLILSRATPDWVAASDATEAPATLPPVPTSRRGLTAVTLLCAALVAVVAYVVGSAVGSASSAPGAHRPVLTSRHDQAPKLQRIAYRPAPATAPKHVRKAAPSSSVATKRRAAAFGIAFFGDSVSVGFGASDRNLGYVARVSGWLRTHGKRVTETVHAKGGVPVGYWAYSPVPTHLDVAVIELGTNDVRLGTSSARFAYLYRTLTSRIRAANPKAHLICLSIWPHIGGSSLDGVINAQIRAVCPGTYVDITGLRDLPHIRSSDGFHPNDVGYRLIAQAVESKLKTS